MALVGVKANVGRVLFSPLNHGTITIRPFLNGKLNPVFAVQTASISGSSLRDKCARRPPPYPYRTKPYRLINSIFDHTTYRFDDNSKIIVVEGPPAAGKTQFAKHLAKDLDMLHLPEVDLDTVYINDYGFDLRTLDPQLPDSCKSYDIKDFCKDPNHVNAANFQILMYRQRFSQYVDALAHLLNTGQGVVLERCVYSDFVFLEAMFKSCFISREARSVYYDIMNNTISELMKPHLVIYLDVPVAKVQERINKRNSNNEVGSKATSNKYLAMLEELYKQRYLKEISGHAELLVYDWSADDGDVEVIIEDIERIDFDKFDKHDPKMKDWRLSNEWKWNEFRMLYTTGKPNLMNYFNVPRYDVSELVILPEDAMIKNRVLQNAPGQKYRLGYNADMGDTGLLTKVYLEYRDTK